MPKPSFVAALGLSLAFAAVARADGALESPKLDTGAISGVLLQKDGALPVRAFKGIPYAAPPVGALRWRPPQPAPSWEGVRACEAFGPACPQPKIPFVQLRERQSEDCLYLNVWTGAREPGAKLPVMVWIHGGSLVFGSGAQEVYDGAALARLGVVVVTINYRLGPFGFLAHPALSQESPRRVSGNYGLLDQVAALEWVNRNIAAFGGDPGCVTIFGESAGGGSVQALLLSPLARGLFQRAIVQSAASVTQPLRGGAAGAESAEATGERFAAALGLSPEGDVLAALRARSEAELLACSDSQPEAITPRGVRFGSCVDGWVLPDDPLALVAAGKQADVPLLIGTTADEGTLFVRDVRSRADVARHLESAFGPAAPKVAAAYPIASDAEAQRVSARLLADAVFVAPTRAFVRARPGFRSKAFLYTFTRVPFGAKVLGLGAHHGCELGYVFDTLDAPGSMGIQPADRALARTVSGAWVRFARTGDPNGEGLPEWPAYTPENDAHFELGDEVRAGAGLRSAQCDLFDEVWAALRPKAAPKRWY